MKFEAEKDEQKIMVHVEFYDDNYSSRNLPTAEIDVPEGTKITEAAAMAGVYIPTLCHHPRLTPVGKCGVCVVAVEDGPTPNQLACSTVCRLNDDGSPMKIHVNGPELNRLSSVALRRSMELSLVHQTKRFESQNGYAPCGSLEIEELAKWIGNSGKDTSSKSIVYDPSLCIGCSRCVRACNEVQGMKVLDAPLPSSTAAASIGIAAAPPCMTTRSGQVLKETDCISCGQCTIFCPTGAIKEVDHTSMVMRALLDPTKVVVLQTAPSVRVAIAEMFGGSPLQCTEGKLVGAAKACGFRFVFDTNLAADLTIMEEANELLQRIKISKSGTPEQKAEKPLPMFTSCCPAWINLVEQSYPHLIPHLSSCRSPMSMLSSVIRHHWWPRQTNVLSQHGKRRVANQDQIDQSQLVVVAVMPCTAKKDEIAREQFRMRGGDGRAETDAVLTTREFGRLMELRGVAQRNDNSSFENIPELVYDNPFGESTGAAMIFGVTGGVMEAALRTAADVLSGQNLESVNYNDVRGLSGIKEATVQLGPNKEIELNVAVSHQMRNVRDFLAQIEQGKKSYHFIEIMTCPGGCIGGGGQPQSRDPDILSKRMKSVYTLDERMVKRKSHDNEAVKNLYAELLGKPLSHVSHELLHTRYFARPRPAARSLKAPSKLVQLGEESGNTIYVVFGTQSGTAAQAAKDVKMELQQFIGRAKLCPEPDVSLIAGDALPPNSLMKAVTESLATIFVTCTFGEGEFPTTMEGLWDFLSECDQGSFSEKPFRYAVFGLGSSMYAAGDQFNRAARRLDTRLNELGGDRMVPVGLGDDQSSEQYRGELDKWMETLFPKLFGKKKVAASLLDPPEPLFRLSMAPGKHPTRFHPLPPKYHFITLESTKSVVSPGYSRPAAIFTFSLEETGLSYEVGDHLALLPRNPEEVVESILALYGPEIIGRDLFAVETVDVHGDCPFPPVLSAHELLSQYLDLCGRPSRGFLKQMYLFATTLASREKLRGLYERNDNPQSAEEKDDFELYTDTHTYADVICDFAMECLPPFEYLLSMVPVICPRLYSIASSPLHRENRLDLLVVLNQWHDANDKDRTGLATKFLFGMRPGSTIAVQIRRGILQPPDDTESPILMFGLGTGVAPFRGFLQHRHALRVRHGAKLGPAALYVGFRHENHDFYLKDDYDMWREDGVLTAVHPAFSHDNLDQRNGRLYFISDLIEERPQDMAKALQLQSNIKAANTKNLHVFYCGPAQGIPDKIQKSMEAAIANKEGGGIDEDDARQFMDRLVRREDRFHAECF